MFDIGFFEIVMVAVVALLVLGPERLPEAARTAGKWVGQAKRMVNQLTQEVEKQVKADEIRSRLEQQGESLNIMEDVHKIQDTVQNALDEAKKFEHFANQDATTDTVATPASAPVTEPVSHPDKDIPKSDKTT
jgi:sec-independent protein translocase protein TatB